MVHWSFLTNTLRAFRFPPMVIKWIHACITIPRFSINVNGELASYFPSKGIRQGDPMSPYLFVILMEVLTRILLKEIQNSPLFKFHWKRSKQRIAQICFARDLFLLCHGDINSAQILRRALDKFQMLSGLKVYLGILDTPWEQHLLNTLASLISLPSSRCKTVKSL